MSNPTGVTRVVTKRKEPAKSYAGRFGKRRIVIEFDADTFSQIAALAAKDNISFGQKARELIEWGLEA